MKHLSPIDFLKERLSEYEHALNKSIKSLNEGKIDAQTHNIHLLSLNKKITEYKRAIEKLER